jgi:hypothetical protein
MKKTFSRILFMGFAFSAVVACSKDSSSDHSLTVANISGTYALKAIILSYGGINFNAYDSLDACEKDNLVKFNTDKTVNFIDAGTVCSPSEDDNDTWDVRNDSIILGSSPSGKINSFDGTTLVVTASADDQYPGAVSTTTLQKQ